MVTHKTTGQKLSKVDRSKKKPSSLAAVGAKVHAAAAKAGGTLSVKKGLVEKDRDDAASAPRQQSLPAPGMVEKLDSELDDLAGKLSLAIEKRKGANTYVKEREDVLIQKMKAKKRTSYVNRGLGIEINLEAVDRVRVKQYDMNESSDYE